jgi:hypothetical protein
VLDLSLLLMPGFGICAREVIGGIVPNDFEQALVCAVDVFELNIKHWIDPVLRGAIPETGSPTGIPSRLKGFEMLLRSFFVETGLIGDLSCRALH